MKIIGDIHGNVKSLPLNDSFIQLGDFGFREAHEWAKSNLKYNHKVLFGNHDDYRYLDENYSLGNYGAYGDQIGYVRGADSIDKYFRLVGVDWFKEEELNYLESCDCLDYFQSHKPEIMISHDCPQFLVNYPSSNTRLLLEEVYNIIKPKLWIYGHHHVSSDITVHDTRFVCLNIEETFTIGSRSV